MRLNFKKLNLDNLKKLDLHTSKISEHSSIIAKKKNKGNIKKFSIDLLKKNKNCCIEGRDISTKILPQSNIKFFFKCSLNKAALRRYKELKKKDKKITLDQVKNALRIRNIKDTRRKHSPLLRHRNSIVIDTGKLSKLAMLAKMSKHVEKVLKEYEK